EKLDGLIRTCFELYGLIRDVGTLVLKLFFSLFLMYYGNWKIGATFYLLSNVIGSGTLFYYLFRFSWYFLRYCVAD
ncbi:unnamed protein product, partial [Amoebophrya sp. A25]